MAGDNSAQVQFPDWEPQFHAAVHETDPEQLYQRIMAAEEAIFLKQQGLVGASNADAEFDAMRAAVEALGVIRIEKLNYPDWKKK